MILPMRSSKKNGYDVNAVESAFSILAKMSEGTQSDFLTGMMSLAPGLQRKSRKSQEESRKGGFVQKAYVHKYACGSQAKNHHHDHQKNYDHNKENNHYHQKIKIGFSIVFLNKKQNFSVLLFC